MISNLTWERTIRRQSQEDTHFTYHNNIKGLSRETNCQVREAKSTLELIIETVDKVSDVYSPKTIEETEA